MTNECHSTWPGRSRYARAAAFTLVELMVVMGIIVLLIAAVVTVGSSVIDNSRAKDTQGMLEQVQSAIKAFEREAPKATVHVRQGDVRYSDRYGTYPPDECEVFTPAGLPGSGNKGRTLLPGGAIISPGPPGADYGNMTFGLRATDLSAEHRDIVALVTAIEYFSEEGRNILSHLPERYWVQCASRGPTSRPQQYIDRDPFGQYTPGADEATRWLVDDWGVPLRYFAQRDYDDGESSSNYSLGETDWNRVSTEMIRVNNGQPIIMSFGPNGKDQLAGADPDIRTLMLGDWADDQRINHPMNDDNIYVVPELAVKLRDGAQNRTQFP